ncbi:MAG: TraB/GumN family protein [Gammaproteobacteria bacterium]|nr:MAG: TraB/GumN family protein [Gammaproteobacteria bacterium]
MNRQRDRHQYDLDTPQEIPAGSGRMRIKSPPARPSRRAAVILVLAALAAPLPASGSDKDTHPERSTQMAALDGAPASKATTSRTSPPAPALKFNKGLLWKIEPPGRPPSYLFGTIHSTDRRVTRLPPAVRTAFDEATSFTMELLISGAGIASMADAMFFNDGRTLPGVAGEDLYIEAKQAMADNGLPVQDLDKKKPWVVIMLLSAPPAEPKLALDLLLQLQATVQGKRVYGLETMAEQIAVFDGMSIDEQVVLLKETIRTRAQSARQYDSLLQAYLKRDLGKLMSLVYGSGPQGTPAYDNLLDRLLTRRNVLMAQRMRARIETGNAFIAIGAAHLAGERGLLRLLEQQGYRVTAVY